MGRSGELGDKCQMNGTSFLANPKFSSGPHLGI